MTQDILNADALLDTFKSMNSDYITSDDFKDTTFKGFFTSDINRPSLDNHVFMLYEIDLKTPNQIIREERFKKSPMFYNSIYKTIKKTPCEIFSFVMPTRETKDLLSEVKKHFHGSIAEYDYEDGWLDEIFGEERQTH